MHLLLVRVAEKDGSFLCDIDSCAREDATPTEREVASVLEAVVTERFEQMCRTWFAKAPVFGLAQVPTADLVAELIKRDGVEEHWAKVAEPYAVIVGGGRQQGLGAARILVVTE